jgi:hypothetical protein
LISATQVPPYVGDDAFKVFLEEHGCPTGFEEIRMRLLGAMVSPGREADIYPLVEDFFEYDMPAFSNGSELEAFLHTFLGLWNEVDESSRHHPITLSAMGTISSNSEVEDLLARRVDEVMFGFLEGVWGGEDELPLTETTAATLTGIEETARSYDELFVEVVRKDDAAITRSIADLLRGIIEVDKAVEAAITTAVEAFRNDSSTDHPPMKRAKALIDELSFGEGLPRATIRECIARKDELVPMFLEILRGYAEGRPAIDDREGALFFVIHILGELEERRAFAPLMDLLNGEPERVEAVLGDAITETVQMLIISVFDGNLNALYKVINNPSADEFARNATFRAWAYLVDTGAIDHVEAERYLRDCVDTLLPQQSNYIWGCWLDVIAILGFEQLRPLVDKVFERGWVPGTEMHKKDFDQAMEDSLAARNDRMAFLKSERLEPFTDTIGTFSQWYGFSEDFLRKKSQPKNAAQKVALENFTNPFKHVGRNDPCPCGSGKKFKKCCLH